MSFMHALARAVTAAASIMVVSPVWAHGPQIQLTADGGQITTRRLIADGPYSTTLTAQTSIYVMPTVQTSGVWVVKPIAAFASGPGIAPGYGVTDLASLATHPFKAGNYSVNFTGGLQKWNGSAFVDAGATQMKAVKSAATTTSVDGGPSPQLTWSISAASWEDVGHGLAETHSGLAFRLVGDGVLDTSTLDDGVYLAGLQLSHGSLTPSAPFYFIVPKGVSPDVTGAATHAWAALQGISSSEIQALTQIPEPTGAALVALGVVTGLVWSRQRERNRAKR